MNKFFRSIFSFLSKILLSGFYDKKYFYGKYFEGDSVLGWVWCWKNFFMQKVIGYNRSIPWPVSHRNIVGNPSNLIFDMNDLNNFQHFGCYFQCWEGKIYIGKGTFIAQNVGIITQNHDIQELNNHEAAKNVIIGEDCWIGMNSVILPGVELGPKTVVGAGSIVTKSFKEGNCVVVGNPARIIKKMTI